MIKVNLGKAKEIAHEYRRIARADTFKPLDIQATIPKYAEEAEAKREEVRQQYAVMQIQIDEAQTPQQIKEVIAEIL